MTQIFKRFFFHLVVVSVGLLIVLYSFPIFAFASGVNSEFKVSGWIPYWQDTKGITDAAAHLQYIDTVNPFVFSVKNDGSLKDLSSGLATSSWQQFIKKAHQQDVEVIPTVMWSDGAQINTVLANASLRTKHEDAIVAMVQEGKYDGVDIDYEGKLAETKDDFSLFLKELKSKLGSKILSCTVEPRTPPDSLYAVIPADIAYANDYTAIGQACDRVEIMAYDQQRADIQLDALRQGAPYMPLSDDDWVTKVVQLALKEIPASKIMLGVPTYGHQYTVTTAPQWYKDYTRVGSLSMPDALSLASQYKVVPFRNSGGETTFTYFPNDSVYTALHTLPVPAGTPNGNTAAAQALLYSTLSGQPAQFNIVVYSDAGSVQRKIEIAKQYHLRGIALYKIDGDEDPNIWQVLK